MNIEKLKKDFIWYSIGAAVPMILSFIKTPIFTRYYSPTDFGNFALINTTSSYINLFTYSWLLSCIWRFYIHEKNNKELNKFYTNIIVLFFIGFIATTIIMLVWVWFTNDITVKKLIIANYLSLITTTITTIYLTTIRLDGKSLIYNLCTVSVSVLSFIILLALAFVFKNSIDAMLNCGNIVNGIFIIYIIYMFHKSYRFNRKYISKDMMKEFITYGFATVFFNMSLSLLTSGDRYVIKIFYSTDKVGIYNQIYSLSQISIVALSNIFLNIINPYIFKLYEEDIHNEKEFYKYITLYTIFILPFTVYFSLYSKEIADLLLGKEFRIGYTMMPYVMITSFIYGLSGMHETRMKFKDRLKAISINLITACILNIALNFILIPAEGYEVAAITTLMSYIYLYIMDIRRDVEDFHVVIRILKDKLILIISVFLILSIEIISHFLIKKFVSHYTVKSAIIEGIIFSSVFYLYIYNEYIALLKEVSIIKSWTSSSKKFLKKILLSEFAININTRIPFLRWIYFRYMTSGTPVPITFSNLFYQKILGINRRAYWPVHYTSKVIGVENITIGVGAAPGLSPNCYILGINKISIGDYTLIEPGVGIISANHNFNNYNKYIYGPGIIIGRYCWLGMNSVILPGVNLGDHTIVAPNSVVESSFEDGYCVIGGVPAKKIRNIDKRYVVEYRNRYEFCGYSPKRWEDVK